MLRSIVNEIRSHVEQCKSCRPAESLLFQPGNHSFRQSLAQHPWALLAECKLASPAKGRLCPNLTVAELASIFSNNGAAVLSVHTSHPFLGKLSDLNDVKKVSSLPLLRKDFIIDEYQILESRTSGADAILLIAAILSNNQIKLFLHLAGQLGMDCLVEIHDREELNRIKKINGVEWVGINNRNLRTFSTCIENTFELLPACDESWNIISESGIQTQADARTLKEAGIKGILVGESLVKAKNIALQTRLLAYPDRGGDENAR